MKNIVAGFCLLFSTLSFAAMHEPASLLAADSEFCMAAQDPNMIVSCAEGSSFYRTEDGRCACLTEEQRVDPDTCSMARFTCDEDKGEVYSQLFFYYNLCDMIQQVFAGCGCYTVQSAE